MEIQFSGHKRDDTSGQWEIIPSQKAQKTKMIGSVPPEKVTHRAQQQLETLLQYLLDRTVEKQK